MRIGMRPYASRLVGLQPDRLHWLAIANRVRISCSAARSSNEAWAISTITRRIAPVNANVPASGVWCLNALLPRHRELEPLLHAYQVIGIAGRGVDVDLHPLDRPVEGVPARAVV